MKVICWDLDGTLGEFSRLSNSWGRFWVRESIPELIDFCAQHRVSQVLTTNATKRYAELALKKSGLAPYFSKIFSQKEVMAWNGKKYQPVLDCFPQAELLIIGDRIQDKPLDVPAVFLWDTTSPEMPADVLKELLIGFLKAPSYQENAWSLYQTAKKQEDVRIFHPKAEGRCSIVYASYEGISGQLMEIPIIAIEPLREEP